MTAPDPRMPTTPANVAFVAPCPGCGRDVPWRGTWREAGTGTEYRIDCGCQSTAEREEVA